MNKRRLIMIAAVLFAAVLAAYFEPTYCVRGWLRGEAFFDGRPTSYWVAVIEQDLELDPDVLGGLKPPPVPSTLDRFRELLGLEQSSGQSKRLLQGESEPVLVQLRSVEHPRVAAFAEDAPNVDKNWIGWMRLLAKHNVRYPGTSIVLD